LNSLDPLYVKSTSVKVGWELLIAVSIKRAPTRRADISRATLGSRSVPFNVGLNVICVMSWRVLSN
jgi:hypothetical protein